MVVGRVRHARPSLPPDGTLQWSTWDGWPIRGEADGGWGTLGGVDDKSNMKVVDADHGIIVHYQSHYWICGDQVDENKVLVCWCEKC